MLSYWPGRCVGVAIDLCSEGIRNASARVTDDPIEMILCFFVFSKYSKSCFSTLKYGTAVYFQAIFF